MGNVIWSNTNLTDKLWPLVNKCLNTVVRLTSLFILSLILSLIQCPFFSSTICHISNLIQTYPTLKFCPTLISHCLRYTLSCLISSIFYSFPLPLSCLNLSYPNLPHPVLFFSECWKVLTVVYKVITFYDSSLFVSLTLSRSWPKCLAGGLWSPTCPGCRTSSSLKLQSGVQSQALLTFTVLPGPWRSVSPSESCWVCSWRRSG